MQHQLPVSWGDKEFWLTMHRSLCCMRMCLKERLLVTLISASIKLKKNNKNKQKHCTDSHTQNNTHIHFLDAEICHCGPKIHTDIK